MKRKNKITVTCHDSAKHRNIFTIKDILSVIYCDGELLVTYDNGHEITTETFNTKNMKPLTFLTIE